MQDLGAFTVLIAVLAGALRVSTPFLFVSLGECLTEKSGRINLGNEGVLVLGAMTAYAVSFETGSPWVGVMAAAAVGALLGTLHAIICSLPRVNDIAVGIAIMLAGIGIAFFFGKPYVQPSAPLLPTISLGFWSNAIRLYATATGSALAGIGGAFLSLVYPGSWNEGLSSGQGLIAVALVVFARWEPRACIGASLIFGAAGALGPSLQTIGFAKGYYLFNAAPYVLTLVLMLLSVAPGRALKGVPGELSIVR
jgi:simple sugar transport system permease protein